ncbi:MAG: alpha/beta hydrolase-fold protein [Acidobacteriota bacterium]
MKKILLLIPLLLLSSTASLPRQSEALRFEVTVAQSVSPESKNGRLFLLFGKRLSPEPRMTTGNTSLEADPFFARDVTDFTHGKTAIIDDKAVGFPVESLSRLASGEYYIQALFDTNADLKSINSPGNLYSAPQPLALDPARSGAIKIELTQKIPPEELPPDTQHIKYIKIKSELLSRFHNRPIYLRAGVILPRDYATDAAKRFPLRVHIGGYGSRFLNVRARMLDGAGFRRAWEDKTAPSMILLHLDGDGPFGDCYQINSENNGPYGDAITGELIPYVEKQFRAIGEPWARVVDGGSTGGWVSLALQIFYPDFFNGAWSYCPDGVDFRAFQLINIYQDRNAYINRYGFERPSARDANGDVRFTIRHECRMENALGAGDSWAMSGEQWGAWNAAYGPRGEDRRPRPLWNPVTGEIDRAVTEHWKKYDLRLILQQNWNTLGPRLRGKINIWIGEADDYFLNNAVHLLDAFLSKATPPYEGRIVYGPGKGHCWLSISELEMMKEMAARIEQSRR